MASLESTKAQDFLALKDFNWRSAETTRPRWRFGSAARKEHSFLEASFAGVIAALTFAYFLWECFRFLSLVLNWDDSPPRALASGGSDHGECLKDVEESEFDRGEGRARRRRRVANRRQNVPESHEEAQSAEESTPFTQGWGRRKMPPEWNDRTQLELLRLRELAATCAAATQVMSAEEGLKLTFHVAMMATMELSGYCYIPQHIQGHRTKAGEAVCELIENAINNPSWLPAAVAGGYTLVFVQLQDMVRRVCKVPAVKEHISATKYKGKFIMHWRLSRHAVTLLKNNLLELLSMRQEPAALADGVRKVLLVAEALWEVRKTQVLGDTFLRYWFSRCHRQLSAPDILFTQSDYDAAVRNRSRSVDQQDQEITAAVAQAGGSLSIPGYSIATSPSHEGLLARNSTRASFAGRAEAHQLPEAQQQVESEGASQRRHGPNVTAFEASVRIARELQLLPALVQSEYEVLGARPRAHATRDENLQAARALGWGPGEMPEDVQDSMKALVTIISKMASECSRLITVLEPQQASSLAVVVASLTAVNLASLAAVPSTVQPCRAEAGRTLLRMVQATLDTLHSLEPAKRAHNEKRLRGLQILMAHVTRPLQPLEPFSTELYLVHMMESWRLINLSVKKALGLIRSFRSCTTLEEGDRIVAALEALLQTRKLQLLADPTLGGWFAACHSGSSPGLLFTQEEHEAAVRSAKQPIGQKMADLSRAVEQAQTRPIRVLKEKLSTPADERPLPVGTRSSQPPTARLGDVTEHRSSRFGNLAPLPLSTFPLPPEAHKSLSRESTTSSFLQAAHPFKVKPAGAPFWRKSEPSFRAYSQAEEQRPQTPFSVATPPPPGLDPVVSVELPPEFSIPFPTRFYPTFLEPPQHPRDEPLLSARRPIPHYNPGQVVRRSMWPPSGGLAGDSGRLNPRNEEPEGSGGPQQHTAEQYDVTLLSTIFSYWRAFSEDASSKE
ncbi:hypothetical protein Emag_003313 [Eimeria magna]